ncbi:REP-associated tyrosine transposase [Marinomonas epiphytica]
MPNYIRSYKNGGVYFFTVALTDRKSNLLTAQIDLLRDSVKKVKQKHPFHIIAWVVLPDHIHAIWQLPESDWNFSIRWQLIKTHFTKRVHSKHKLRGKIWQNRFWEHEIKTDLDLINHIHYVYYNPVKHGHVQQVKEWPYSSFHRDVKQGLFDENWNL